MTGSMYEGLGYTPNGVQSAATKPVSGESIVTFLERMDAIAEHGTKAGYDGGCRGSHCPGKESVGMSCSQASIRYAGDMGYRRRVDGGMTAEAIWAEDQAAHVVMPKVNVREAEEPAVSAGERPAAAPAGKWAVRRVWVAVAPDGKLHGPFQSQPKAVLFVGEQMPKVTPAGKRTRRRITDEERAAFRRLHSEGLSTGKIAKQTGRALSVVARELGLMGLASNGHRFGTKWS